MAARHVAVEINSELLHVLAEAGRVDDALEVGEQLLRELSDEDPSRADVHLMLARAAATAGRWPPARAQITHVRSADSVPLPHVDALAAQIELGAGQPQDAVCLAERVLASTGPTEHPVHCEALEVLGRVARLLDIDEARAIFTRQLAVAEEGALAVWRLRALLQLDAATQRRRPSAPRRSRPGRRPASEPTTTRHRGRARVPPARWPSRRRAPRPARSPPETPPRPPGHPRRPYRPSGRAGNRTSVPLGLAGGPGLVPETRDLRRPRSTPSSIAACGRLTGQRPTCPSGPSRTR